MGKTPVINKQLDVTNERLNQIKNVLADHFDIPSTIFGFHIDSTESDPDDAVTYLKDAVGKTPAFMNYDNGTFNYGSWEDAFFMPKPCMLKYDGTVDYYLNPNNYAYKEDGVTPSDVNDPTYEGNAMMEWGQNGRKIWYKIVPDASPESVSIYVADHQADENFVAWPFINNQGLYVDHFYTPIYNGTIVNDGSNDVLRSLSGMSWNTYGCKGKTASVERTAARHNNDDDAIWDTEVFCDNLLIEILLTLMSKSLDTQTAFGKGLTDSGSEAVNNGFATGVHDAKGLFYGANSGAASTYANAVKVFGMENFWGFQWRRFGGLVNVNGTAKYKLTRGKQDGSSATDYVISTTAADYADYKTGGSLPASSGYYIKDQIWNSDMPTPKTAPSDGTSSQYYCDGLWTNNGQVDYAYRGGVSLASSLCGAWCLRLNDTASLAYWHLGAAPSCKPLS